MKEMIHVIINDMRQIKEALKMVANKLICKYPKIFKDVDDGGVVMGDGCCTTFTKLMKCINEYRDCFATDLTEMDCTANAEL